MKIKYLHIVHIFLSLSLSGQEIITFTSADPFGFQDIITNLENLEENEVSGILKLPEGEGPFPLVLGVAGSLEWGEHHVEYMEMYRKMGRATFELQRFSSRGIKSTVG